jgi:hypothetical protein
MRSLLVVAALLAVSPFASAQQSLFQSGDGQTSLYLRQATAAINLGDSKASFGYVHRVNIKPTSFGFDGYATANSGLTSLFSSDKPKAPEGGFDGMVARHYVFAKMPTPGTSGTAKEDTLLLDAGYGRSSFYEYATNAAPSTSAPKTNFDRFRVVAAYNFFLGGDKIFGIASGAERRNNLADLKAASIETVLVAAPTGTTSSVVKTQAGYYGDYKTYVGAPVYTDFLYFLPKLKKPIPGFDYRLGIDLLTRSDLGAVNRSAKGGFGLFLLKGSDPLSPIGGFTATFDGTTYQLSLTTGITFPAPPK